MRARFALGLVVVVFVSATCSAEPVKAIGADYGQANKFNANYLRQFTYDTAVTPNFIGKTDLFWYSFRTSQGTQFWRVDPKAAKKEPLFDRTKVAMQLSELLQKAVEATQLPITRGSINDEGTKFKFVSGEWQFEYDLKAEKLAKLGKAPAQPGLQRPPDNASEEERRRYFEQLRQRQEQQQEEKKDDQQQDEKKDDQQQDEKKDDKKDDQRQRGGRGGRGFGGAGGGFGGDFRNMAPDKKGYLFVQKHNLYYVEIVEGKEKEPMQITNDGVEDYSFASFGGFGGGGRRGETQEQQTVASQAAAERKSRPNATWSKDSSAYFVSRSDSRGVQELYLVNALAEPRPLHEKQKYAMPGEEAIRKTELYYADRTAKKLTRVPPKWKDESYSNIHFGKTPEELRFVRVDRLRRHLEFCALNIKTGAQKCLLAEGFEAALLEFQPVKYLEESDEMIWWSERSGWGHYYLCDRNGKLKNAITSGSYRASRIVGDIDTKTRTMWFIANAREPGENVYYQHLYSVKLDGTGLTLLDSGNANHTSTLSPTKQYLVDNSSRIDQAPFSVLRDATGKKIMDLEKCDLARLTEVGWKMPETFMVKAADGVTDLYGNMWKPFDFDGKKKYPIIVYVYPGPQQEGVTHTFSASSNYQQLAQLGFIVIQVGHRGGTPTRSKAYASYGYFNLRDYGLADKKSAIEQLAARHAWIDIERVGIYGHSGGGFMSAAALLQKPYNEFFKAAVASAGNHDNNIYNNSWSERYHGLKEVVVKKDETKTTSAGATKTPPPKSKDAGKKDEMGSAAPPVKDSAKKDGKKGGPEEAKEAANTAADKKDENKSTSPIAFADTKFEIKVPTNTELAANLKGAILLVHGDLDNNVHPANTMRLVDALIKANKRFDMLIIPGARHGFGTAQGYFTQRMWDFFADHLLNHRSTNADISDKTPRK